MAQKPSTEGGPLAGASKPPSLPPGFKRGERVTLPLISIKHNPVLYVRIESQMATNRLEGSGAEDQPMTTVTVTDLSDPGEKKLLVCPTVLVSALLRYKTGYVGKCFELREVPAPTGKRYRNVEVYELTQ